MSEGSESDVREFRSDMRDVRERLVRVEEKVAHLPSKRFVFSVVMIGFALVAGVVTFQSQIQTLITPSSLSTTP